jgi:Na+/phosphate symporter
VTIQETYVKVDTDSIRASLLNDKKAQQNAMEMRQQAREEERRRREELHDRQTVQYELDTKTNQ